VPFAHPQTPARIQRSVALDDRRHRTDDDGPVMRTRVLVRLGHIVAQRRGIQGIFDRNNSPNLERISPMADNVTRRQFVQEGAVAAVALASGLASARIVQAGNPTNQGTSTILNYNADMEYRQLGKTGLMISAVALGGHWKRVDTMIGKATSNGWLSQDIQSSGFLRNRAEVVNRCIDRGINYVDACTPEEVLAYAKVLRGRREKIYFGVSWCAQESRIPEWRPRKKLMQTLDQGMKQAGLDHVDLWRITLLEQSVQHSDAEIEEAMAALDWARKTGRARFTGVSSHHRPHIKKMIEKYPDQIQVVLTPYTADTKVVTDESGLWAAIKKHDVGWLGIKPFASNSLFKGDSSPASPYAREDNRLARLAIRYVLCNPAITAPIPGLISVKQVDNIALAIKERRVLDLAEQNELKDAMDRAWAGLPPSYDWLRDWEYV
jgi:aryl-alcohol dehydrogenase-like predicted oxidoreductase